MIEKLNPNKKTFSFNWHDKEITFETGLLAPQAEWSVVVHFDGIKFLGTATINQNPDENKDFTPLTVDFREMFYSAGKIGGAPYKRKEWKPSDEAILVSRLIDRSIRPMFAEWMTNDVVLTINTLQVDKKNLYGVPGILAANLSVMLAWIPFEWPVGAVRIWYKDGKFIVNPTKEEIDKMNLVIAGTKDTITMIEAGWEDIPTDILMQAIEIAQKELNFICSKMEEFIKQVLPENKKIQITTNLPSNQLFEKVYEITKNYENKFFVTNKKQFQEVYNNLTDEVNNWFENLSDEEKSSLIPENKDSNTQLKITIFKAVKKLLRKHLLETWQRLDGRNPLQVRPLYTQVWLLDKVHGSWLFQRWETQVLSITTLGAPWKVLLQDTLEKDDYEERFMHHYYMLPFSTNEARSYRWQWRREIWHWYLAEKTLRPIIPNEDEFPYTIRVVSEVLSSNGSTSMASVCAWCMSLMDAWVPIKKPVSWVAMGLVIEKLTPEQVEKYKENNPYLNITEINWETYWYIILTDLQGQEDFTWDMDFKVAWSKDWINALQMDMKVKWLPMEVLQQAIQQANQARIQILEFMLQTIPESRKELSPYAPRLYTLKLTPDDVRNVIWKWWETIKKIIDETWVAIDFKEDGTTIITAEDGLAAQKAIDMINEIVRKPTIWERIKWIVKKVESFWVFVDLWHGKTGLCHISNLSSDFVKDPHEIVKEWDEIIVEIINIKEDGKIEIKKVE